MKCPKCGVPGAYVGLNSVECRNSKCEHFTINEEVVCPCCGIAGHTPKYEMMGADLSDSKDYSAIPPNFPLEGM